MLVAVGLTEPSGHALLTMAYLPEPSGSATNCQYWYFWMVSASSVMGVLLHNCPTVACVASSVTRGESLQTSSMARPLRVSVARVTRR